MNMMDESTDAVVIITYEYIPKPSDSFAHVKTLWLNIGGCQTADMPAYKNTTFNYTSPAWTATMDGRVTTIVSHLHDGGTHLEVRNNKDVVCDAVATYGGNPAYISDLPMNMTMDGQTMEMTMKMTDISSLDVCSNVGVVKPGDEWFIRAFYNTSEYAPMADSDGKLMPIMGISLVYFVEGNYVNASNGTEILKHESPVELSSSQSSSTQSKTNAASTLASGAAMYLILVAIVFSL